MAVAQAVVGCRLKEMNSLKNVSLVSLVTNGTGENDSKVLNSHTELNRNSLERLGIGKETSETGQSAQNRLETSHGTGDFTGNASHGTRMRASVHSTLIPEDVTESKRHLKARRKSCAISILPVSWAKSVLEHCIA